MKLAVVFPGIGYHTDKPLLYYAKKLAKSYGYHVAEVPYKDFPENVRGSSSKMEEAFFGALAQAEAMLQDVDFSRYDTILFVSKSVGTVVAGAFAKAHHLKPYNIFFTPVEQTFSFVQGSGIVFHGTKDPWVETDIVKEACRQRNLPLYLTKEANHSLETGEVLADLNHLSIIMEQSREYFEKIEREREKQGQPFPAGTGGSRYFRIPSLITLSDGTLLAASDARYSTTVDGGGLDTILAVSEDNGATWRHSFPIRFDDSEGFAGTDATTIIDPVMVQGADDTIYLMADVNPTGITTCEWAGFQFPHEGTGYITVEGRSRLALTSDYANTNTNPKGSPDHVYAFYVGDFGEDGLAPVYSRKDHTASGYAVDQMYNLYRYQDDGSCTKLMQKQVNRDALVQQNVFFRDSELHVYNTGYMWMAVSEDRGMTWKHSILNPQIKRDGETGLLVSPGRGTVTKNGTIVIPFYHFKKWELHASFIYLTEKNGVWRRSEDLSLSSSESEMVELFDGTLRMFYRNGTGYLCYADALWQNDGYVWEEPVLTSVRICSDCNVSAISYSRQSRDGRQVIFLSCPGGGSDFSQERKNGKIFTLLVEKDRTLSVADCYSVNEGVYQYSCLTERKDGEIALLYEDGEASIAYLSLKVEKVSPSVFQTSD